MSRSSDEIESLEKINSSVNALYRRLGDIDSTSEQMVFDYGTRYSMWNVFFWIQIISIIGMAIYFFGVKTPRGMNIAIFIVSLILFYVVILIIVVVKQQFRDYPEGVSGVETTTDNPFQNIEDTISGACFEENCCTDSTEWVVGEGCVALDSDPDSDSDVNGSESFVTYKSMCK